MHLNIPRAGNRATVHLQRKEHQAAIDCLHQYLSAHPENADAWFLAGEAYGHLGQFDKAVADLERCIAANPRHSKALSLMGQAYGIQGNAAKALEYFQQSAAVNPSDPETWFNIGLTHSMGGRLDEAITSLETALKYKPDHQRSLRTLAEVWQRKGDAAKAAQYLQQAGG